MMMRGKFVVSAASALAAAIALTINVPVEAQDRRMLQMAADIRMLQEQNQQLQLLLQALTEAVKSGDSRVSERLEQQADATRKAFADQKLVVDTITTDLRVVREKVDDAGVRIGSLTQEVEALHQSVLALASPPQPLTPLPDGTDAAIPGATPAAGAPATSAGGAQTAGQPAAGSSNPTTPAATTPAPALRPGIGASPQRMWDSAYADYAAGDFDLAILGFEAYIKSFPDSERSDDAQVFICQSYTIQGQYESALQACDQAIRTYPKGDALADAHYRRGIALRSLQRVMEARAAFEFVLKMYPTSPAATLARQRLDELKG